MSHMSRKEIQDLRTQFQKQCDKIEAHEGGLVHPTGMLIVEQELKKCPEGMPSLTLRNLGRLLKHFTEEVKKKPSAVVRFNVAAPMVQRGRDVQIAIREARKLVKDSVNEMEADGLCSAKDHTHLRVDRHDRVLQAMLEI